MMSTYNGANYLSEQLNSIFEQKGADITVFIKDDGSIDGTLQLIANHRHTKRIRQLASKTHLGPARSFLEIIYHIPKHYDYYAFSDQDDVWLPGKLSAACKLLEPKCKAAFYCSALTLVDQDLRVVGKRQLSVNPNDLSRAFFQNFATGNTVVLNNNAFSLLKNHSNPDYLFMHDWWILLLMLVSGATVIYDTKSYILYRQHRLNVIGMKRWRLTVLEWILEIKSGSHIQAALKQLASLLNENIEWADNPSYLMANSLVINSGSTLARIKNIIKGNLKTRTTQRYILYSLAYLLHGAL